MKCFLLPALLSLLVVSQFVDAEDAPRAPRNVRRAARRAEREARTRAAAARGLSEGLVTAGRHAPPTPRVAAALEASDVTEVTSNEILPTPCRPAPLWEGVFSVTGEPELIVVPGNIIQSAEFVPPLPPRDSVESTSLPQPAAKPVVMAGAAASRPILRDDAGADVLSRVVVGGELAGILLPEPGRLDPSILQASFNQVPVAVSGAIVYAEELPPPLPPREKSTTPESGADQGDEPGKGPEMSYVQCLSLGGPSAEEARIRVALNRPVSLHFEQARLSEIFRYIASSQEINIIVDETGLAEEGVTSHDPVSIDVDGVTLKRALDLLLHSRNLAYTIEDEVLKFTGRQRREGELFAQVYSVADLIGRTSSVESPMSQGSESAPPTAPSVADFENVVELIRSTIQPESWNESGGPAAIVPHPGSRSLVIRQTRRGHQEIASLLDGIRRVMKDVQSACEIEQESIHQDTIHIPVTPRIIIQGEEEELLGLPLDPLPANSDSDQRSLQPALPPVILPGTLDVIGIPTHDLLFREEEPEPHLILQTP